MREGFGRRPARMSTFWTTGVDICFCAALPCRCDATHCHCSKDIKLAASAERLDAFLNARACQETNVGFQRLVSVARAMLRFRQMKSLQKFASVHANVHNQLAAPPFGSISNATWSPDRPPRPAVRLRWPIGKPSWP